MKTRNNNAYPLVDEMISWLMNEHYEELKQIDAFPLDVFKQRLIVKMHDALVVEQVPAVCRTIEESLCVSKNTVTKYRKNAMCPIENSCSRPYGLCCYERLWCFERERSATHSLISATEQAPCEHDVKSVKIANA